MHENNSPLLHSIQMGLRVNSDPKSYDRTLPADSLSLLQKTTFFSKRIKNLNKLLFNRF